jgi:hypothetical protein
MHALVLQIMYLISAVTTRAIQEHREYDDYEVTEEAQDPDAVLTDSFGNVHNFLATMTFGCMPDSSVNIGSPDRGT